MVNFLRRALERLARGKVLKRSIQVNGQSVELLVTPDAQLKYLKWGANAFDHDLIHIAETFLNCESVVWDVGANIGVFTFASAAVAAKGTVVSVEADVWLASLLRRSRDLAGNRERDIRIVPVAVAEKDSVATFLVAARGRASNALESAGGRSQMGGVREKQYVPTLKLDTLLETMPPPQFVKMDVEGAELMALRGAVKLIQEVRPVFYIEVGNDVSSEVMALFIEHDYCAFSPEGDLLGSECAPNTFFVPKENKLATTSDRQAFFQERVDK